MHPAVSILLGKLVHPLTDALADAARKAVAKVPRRWSKKLYEKAKKEAEAKQ